MSGEVDQFQEGWLSVKIDSRHAAMVRALMFALGVREGSKSEMLRRLIEGCHRRICQKTEL